MKLKIKQMLKISDVYLDKQKSYIPKRNILRKKKSKFTKPSLAGLAGLIEQTVPHVPCGPSMTVRH